MFALARLIPSVVLLGSRSVRTGVKGVIKTLPKPSFEKRLDVVIMGTPN
eukprot:gene30913-34887_t